MKHQVWLRASAAALAISSAVAVAPAFAQTAVAPENIATGEIVVTATKRSENLQSVPISISAISGDALSKSRTTSVDDLVSKVANLQMTGIVGDNTPIFSLRGVSMSDYSLNQSSPVATYYDEVYKGNFALLGVALYDIERVEVLRGPQGTLYGKNTTGGAVNIISRDAKLGDTSGYLNVGYGNYNRADVNGALNLALTNNLAVRVAGTYAHADGWFRNVLPGYPNLAETREYAFRGTVHWEPTNRLKLVLKASTSYQNPHNYGIYAQNADQSRIGGLSTYQISSDVPTRRRARTASVALTANYNLTDALTLTSITSYDHGTLFFTEDTDGQPNKVLEIPYGDRASQFAQDLRLTSNTKGPFDFILGLYFAREKVFNSNSFNITQDVASGGDLNGDGVVNSLDCQIGAAAGTFAACKLENQFDQLKKSYAAYSDLKYRLTERFSLLGGLRFTHDTGTQTNFQSNVYGADNVFVQTNIPLTNIRYSTNNLSGKIGFDYKLAGGNLLYASISRGYRAPSFNAQAFFQPSEVSVARAEKVTSYEAGLKLRLADRRITLNLAGFYYDYRDQQFINVNPASGAQDLFNIPKSRIFGGEAELTARVSDGFLLHAGLGLLSTKILEGTLSGIDVAGHKLANAPSLSLNVGPDITLAKGKFGTISLHPSIAYQSSQYFEVINEPILKQKGYALLDGHLDYETANGRISASAWVKNAAQQFYFTSRVDLLAGFGFIYNHIGTPRTYGGTLGYKF
jgi:iron complex outermembrane receptor protein